MKSNSTARRVRLTVRIRTDVKEALEALQAKRDRELFTEVSLGDLLTEGALLLLAKEGAPMNGAGHPPEPPRKPVKSAKRKRATMAVEA